MDSPTLIKIKAKRDAFLFALIAVVIVTFLAAFLVMNGTFKIYDLLIPEGILIVIAVIVGVPTAYYSSLVSGYGYLLGVESYPSSNYASALSAMAKDKAIIPDGFFTIGTALGADFRKVYDDSLYSYLYGFPNAALPTSVRCLEVGLKEKYTLLKMQSNKSALNGYDAEFVRKVDEHIVKLSAKHSKVQTVNDLDLFDLIEFAEGYYENKTETLHHLRSLRNFIHGETLIKDNDAHSALTKITDILNILFELPQKINIEVTCKVCGNKHVYDIDKLEYFIGNKKGLDCLNKNIQKENKYYVITLMP